MEFPEKESKDLTKLLIFTLQKIGEAQIKKSTSQLKPEYALKEYSKSYDSAISTFTDGIKYINEKCDKRKEELNKAYLKKTKPLYSSVDNSIKAVGSVEFSSALNTLKSLTPSSVNPLINNSLRDNRIDFVFSLCENWRLAGEDVQSELLKVYDSLKIQFGLNDISTEMQELETLKLRIENLRKGDFNGVVLWDSLSSQELESIAEVDSKFYETLKIKK